MAPLPPLAVSKLFKGPGPFLPSRFTIAKIISTTTRSASECRLLHFPLTVIIKASLTGFLRQARRDLSSFHLNLSSHVVADTPPVEVAALTHLMQLLLPSLVIDRLGHRANVFRGYVRVHIILQPGISQTSFRGTMSEGFSQHPFKLPPKLQGFEFLPWLDFHQLDLGVLCWTRQSAISAHIDWKMKLSRYIENPDQSLKADHVCQDNNCALGKWIYGDGAVYKNQFSTPFENLKLSHAEFHKTAGDIIRLIDNGQRDKAEHVMGPAGKYAQVSERTVELIKDLKSLVEEDQESSSGSDKLAA